MASQGMAVDDDTRGASSLTTHLFLQGRGRAAMTEEEKCVLDEGVASVLRLPARRQIVRAGELVERSTYLIEGYICRYMDDREGHRQLVAVHVPGDFVDLHAFPMKRLDHDVATLGPATIASFEHRTLTEITERHPRLTRFLWFSTLLDAAMHREWIFRLGRLGAEGRLSHFFLELYTRLKMVGLAQDDGFPLPLTQTDLGEACGLTGVHVNRTLRRLREDGLMTFANGVATITDPVRLAALAEFDAAYLYADTTALRWEGENGS